MASEIASAMLCEYASVRAGQITIVNGVVNRIMRRPLPAPLDVYLALVVMISPDERRKVHEVQITVANVDGGATIAPPAVIAVQLADSPNAFPGEALPVPLVGRLMPPVATYGQHDIRVSLDGQPPVMLTVWVIEQLERAALG